MRTILLLLAVASSVGCATDTGSRRSLSDELGLTIVDPRALRPQRQLNCTSIQVGNRTYTECQ